MAKLPRRRFLHLAASAAALPAMPRVASALGYPTRPVHIIVGYAAGLSPDVVARVIAQSLSEQLDQQFVVENKPGAASNIGTRAVVRATPDGYALLLAVATNTFNVTLYPDLDFNFIRDIGGGPFVLVVNPTLPVNSVPELIAYAKAYPYKINMASVGTGSAPHIFGEMFEMMARVHFVHVPYRGNYLSDLLSAQVQVYFGPIASLIEFVKSNKLRALAVTSTSRFNMLPDVPPLANFLPGYEAIGWYGIGAPKATPREILDIVHSKLQMSLADPDVREHLVSLGIEPKPMTSAEFGTLISAETEKWAKIIKFANIKPE
jgi:tripartite-type tricarboxylate transporter receptor subunit TctC